MLVMLMDEKSGRQNLPVLMKELIVFSSDNSRARTISRGFRDICIPLLRAQSPCQPDRTWTKGAENALSCERCTEPFVDEISREGDSHSAHSPDHLSTCSVASIAKSAVCLSGRAPLSPRAADR